MPGVPHYCWVTRSGDLARLVRDLPERIAVLPTTDRYAAIAAMRTNGTNYDLGTGDIIDWLKELETTNPHRITRIAHDTLAGRFTRAVRAPVRLAKAMYELCPDVVDQGCGSVEELARTLRQDRSLFLWWD